MGQSRRQRGRWAELRQALPAWQRRRSWRVRAPAAPAWVLAQVAMDQHLERAQAVPRQQHWQLLAVAEREAQVQAQAQGAAVLCLARACSWWKIQHRTASC
jgi:hypothetical protein